MKKLALSVLGLLAVACLVFVMLSRARDVPVRNGSGSSARGDAVVGSAGQAVRSFDVVERELVDEGVSVLTLTKAGRPIPACRIYWAASGRKRYHRLGDLRDLGVSDPQGFARVDACESGVLLVRHPEFCPAEVEVNPDTRAVEVRLGRGGSIGVLCVDTEGAPVRGARVVVGNSLVGTGPLASADSDVVPGGAVQTAVWMQVSDESGRCIIHGLPEGEIGFRVLHDRMVMHDVRPDIVTVTAGQQIDVVATLAPVEGVLFTLADLDGNAVEIRNWGAVSPRGYATPPSASDLLRTLREKLVREHPATCAVLWARVPGREPSRTAKVRVMTMENGWRTVKPTIKSIAELVEPEVLQVSGGQPCMECTLDLVDSQGRYWEGEGVELYDGAAPPTSVVTGVPSTIPQGRYRIHMDNQLIGSALISDELEIHANNGGRIPVRLSKPLRRIRIRVECQGLPVESLSGMLFVSTDDRGAFVSEFREGALCLLITDGPMECTVDLGNGRRAHKRWTVSESDEELVVSFE